MSSNIKRSAGLFFTSLAFLLITSHVYGSGEKYFSSYETQLLHHINQYRENNGLKPLLPDEHLTKLAETHCRYMNKKNSLSHDNFRERFQESRRSHCVENVGWNYTEPDEQFRAWKNSKGHNKNLLNKTNRYAGIAQVGLYVTFFACN